MHNAEAMGLATAVDTLRDFRARLNPENWVIAPLLESLASSNGKLADFRRG